jgi:glycosyltransferase involved in cell wall biosynthesis
LKLGLLTPRYGEEVVGGTEHWLRLLCEHLVADRGWTVDAYTTCAVSAATWADEYRPGRLEINGVTVHRFRSESHRNPEYLHMLERLRRDASALPADEAERYVRLVGPVCPAAVQAVAADPSDLVAVTPYLYWPAVTAVPRLGRRAVFHTSAHDEPELYLPQMRDVFTAAGGFSYNTFSERALVERTFPIAHLPSAVVGTNVDQGTGDPARARAAMGLAPDEPFVLCLGKVERAKGADALADMWSIYRGRRAPDPVPRLVFIGPTDGHPSPREGVLFAGRQPEEVKWGALAGCELLIAPSVQESFCLVVVEAWLAGRPVIVNSRCGPTVENCRRSGGGVWFDGYAELEAALDRLLADPGLGRAMAERGAEFARRAFSWTAVLDRYEDLAARIAARIPARAG